MQSALTLETFLSLILAAVLGAMVGITTATSLWVTAAIGLTTGIGDFPLSHYCDSACLHDFILKVRSEENRHRTVG